MIMHRFDPDQRIHLAYVEFIAFTTPVHISIMTITGPLGISCATPSSSTTRKN